MPAWLSFDATTRVFSGTPSNADVGSLEIGLTATDPSGAAAADRFAVTVVNVNDAPEIGQHLADQSAQAGSLFRFSVPAATFLDIDAGDSLALSARATGGAPLPRWLSFDAGTGTFSGTPQDADIGISGVAVTATDGSGASATSDFAMVVRAATGSSVSGSAADDVMVGAGGNETLSGGAGNDALFGDAGDDVLRGGSGNDVLQGGSGNDVLRAGTDENLLDAGAGNDVIFDGAGDAFIAGGAGNDTIKVGAGKDVLAFNRGDGSDTVIGGGDGGNTLSLAGINYADLSLSKTGSDLVVNAGGGDRLTFKDWYQGTKSVLTLQMILDATREFDAASSDPLRNRRVETFDFLGLVNAFDQARAQSPGLTSWAVTNALLQFHLRGADDEALGGDLAYWYGRNGSLAGMSLQAAQQIIGTPGFGAEAQQLHAFSGLQDGLVKLG